MQLPNRAAPERISSAMTELVGVAAPRRSVTSSRRVCKYQREAVHFVIDTGRTVAAVTAEISVDAQLLGRGFSTNAVASVPPRRPEGRFGGQSWSGRAGRTTGSGRTMSSWRIAADLFAARTTPRCCDGTNA